MSDTFVIQQHHATSRHYDFRLEVEGVIPSALPPESVVSGRRIEELA